MMFARRFQIDDRGSMPLAMLVITVGLLSSALLTPIVVRQFQSTRALEARDTALNAAQTGLDTLLARVRAAAETDSGNSTSGLLAALPPCQLSGDAGAPGTGESLRYDVTITYQYQDPAATPPNTCPPIRVPIAALVTSVGYGTDGVVKRSLSATYIFPSANTNIPGGAINIDTSSAGKLCFDSGPVTSVTANTKIMMQTCNGSASQQFAYGADLYLKLVNSETSTYGNGLCLFAGPKQATARTHASGDYLNLQSCPDAASGKSGAQFQWSLDGSSQFHSTNTNQGIESLCVNVQTQGLIGSFVVLASCGTSTTADIFRSDAGVGAGMAGFATNQMVNFAQFSRCLDVTSQSVTSTYMIAWFCKQSPNGVVDWNQIWKQIGVSDGKPVLSTSVSTQANIVVNNGSQYCLKSPGTNASNAYVTVTVCPGVSTAPPTVWTIVHDTGDYASSYRIIDYNKFCLTPTDLNAVPKDTHADGTSKVKVATCSGSELQKWNAPPNIEDPSPLTNLKEN